ncbi:unnamed protein product [Chilo suppressalis]|uniref:DNA-directed RNA polymerase III subunit n=1 Tax=Chilo suppressalis TaxID=168631 RepID=A0ABN8AVC5_CHISP|nr:unnamed protein product [Chilo suppressalis]
MAGRGRGRGAGLSLTHDQLQALGIARGETAPAALAPPPLFPKLETKPLPLVSDAATDYMLIVKDQFIEYLHDSPAYVKPKVLTDDVERYSDKYKLLALDAKQGKVLNYVWANMPAELRPQAGRIRTTRKRKLDDPYEIAKRLQTLEKKESQEESEETLQNNESENANAKPKGEVHDDEDIEDEEEQDEEIDDGTDYANNFFDNGEEYDEEDDNLDDGPVY